MNLLKVESKPKDTVIISFEIECIKEQESTIRELIQKQFDDIESKRVAEEIRKEWEEEWSIEKEKFVKYCEQLDWSDDKVFPLGSDLASPKLYSSPQDEYHFKRMIVKSQKLV